MSRSPFIPLGFFAAASLCLASASCTTAPVVEDAPPASEPAVKAADESALASPKPVIMGETFVVPSAILGEKRRISIWTPPGVDPDADLPILYTTDGGRNFPMAVGIINALSSVGSIPKIKVVGVYHTDRGYDMTPYHEPQAPREYNAAQYLQYLTQEVIPLVEGDGQGASVRILLGHSLGGLFNGYAMLHEPAAFDVYISVAGALAWGEGNLFKEAEALLPKIPAGDRLMVLSTASLDGPLPVQQHQKWMGLIDELGPDGLRYTYEAFEGDDHWTIVPKALTAGLRAAFPLIPIDDGFKAAAPQGIEALRAWYQAHKAAMGPRGKIRAADINRAGYAYVVDGEPTTAVSVFTLLTELFPEDANSWDSLGEGLEAAGDKDGAAKAYQKAVNMAAEDDPNLHFYKEHLQKITASP